MRRRQTCSPHFSVMSFWLTLEVPCNCSRICNGQSTKEPQGSTGTDQHEVGYSIRITYFHPISIDFHKRCDLFWDRWSHLHNLHGLNGLQSGRWGSWSAFGICLGTPLEVHPDSLSDDFGSQSGDLVWVSVQETAADSSWQFLSKAPRRAQANVAPRDL